ncbi:MAG: hypothetical protein FWE40_09295 [Oscillospiraceae bacterium]|nr:hypothetical protein [Oscillospiraceae bacterium]
MKNKKLKRTAMFVGIFLGAILLTFVLGTVFRSSPDVELEYTTMTAESTTTSAETTTIEETTTAESTIETTTTESAGTTATTTIPSTTRTPATTTRPLASTTTTTRVITTTRPATTTRPPTTTTRPTTTTTHPPTTTTTTQPANLLAFAIDYGRSIGLIFRPQLTSGGVAVGASQAQIRARLDQARAAGAREFNVWQVGNTIFIATR